jgi:hypothetical protein
LALIFLEIARKDRSNPANASQPLWNPARFETLWSTLIDYSRLGKVRDVPMIAGVLQRVDADGYSRRHLTLSSMNCFCCHREGVIEGSASTVNMFQDLLSALWEHYSQSPGYAPPEILVHRLRACIGEVDEAQPTLLHHVASCLHPARDRFQRDVIREIANILVAEGCPRSKKSTKGHSLLNLAIWSKNKVVIEVLLNHSAADIKIAARERLYTCSAIASKRRITRKRGISD